MNVCAVASSSSSTMIQASSPGRMQSVGVAVDCCADGDDEGLCAVVGPLVIGLPRYLQFVEACLGGGALTSHGSVRAMLQR